MSTEQPHETRKTLDQYTGEYRYAEWIEDYLDVTVTDAQREMCRSVAENERTLVIGANGFGKSYCVACLILAFLFSNYPASVLATSGTYGKLRRTVCKPVNTLHRQSVALPGDYKQVPPRIEIPNEPDVYFQAASPSDAGELEGVHNTYTLGIIEEADKDRVDQEVFDSMESLLTDDRDRLVAIANPPRDEANYVTELMDDPAWNVLNYSSFDSHNVQVELGEVDGEMVDGLVTLDRIQTDWESWNGEPWPGVEEARASEERGDLDQRWYRRRLGVTPPDTADAHRPFKVSEVEAAYERDADGAKYPHGMALDVARMGGDFNSFAAVFGDDLRIIDYWRGTDHVTNEEKVRSAIKAPWECDFAVDATPEGSGLADRIDTFYPNSIRYNAGSNASRMQEFRNKWTEGMYLLGEWLRNGGSFSDRRLREELVCAARCLEYDRRYISSRNAEVLDLDSKSNVKDRLGRSPDLLDSAMMAVWAADDSTGDGADTVPATW